MKQPARQRPNRIFLVPAILAAATLVGLIAGVLGDGAADLLSWIALGAAPAAIGWAIARSPKR